MKRKRLWRGVGSQRRKCGRTCFVWRTSLPHVLVLAVVRRTTSIERLLAKYRYAVAKNNTKNADDRIIYSNTMANSWTPVQHRKFSLCDRKVDSLIRQLVVGCWEQDALRVVASERERAKRAWWSDFQMEDEDKLQIASPKQLRHERRVREKIWTPTNRRQQQQRWRPRGTWRFFNLLQHHLLFYRVSAGPYISRRHPSWHKTTIHLENIPWISRLIFRILKLQQMSPCCGIPDEHYMITSTIFVCLGALVGALEGCLIPRPSTF